MNDHKHLGLTLDSKLTFVNGISEKICKALKGVGAIKYLSSYVRPHLDFCDVIYPTPKICNLFDSSFRMCSIFTFLKT